LSATFKATPLVPGDFDGDGKADVIARDSGGTLWLYSGNGAGGWLAPRLYVGLKSNMFTSAMLKGRSLDS